MSGVPAFGILPPAAVSAVAPNGAAFTLTQNGTLMQTFNGQTKQVDAAVQSFAVAADNSLYDLVQGGALRHQINGTWQNVDSGVQSFALGGDGKLWDLHAGGVE